MSAHYQLREGMCVCVRVLCIIVLTCVLFVDLGQIQESCCVRPLVQPAGQEVEAGRHDHAVGEGLRHPAFQPVCLVAEGPGLGHVVGDPRLGEETEGGDGEGGRPFLGGLLPRAEREAGRRAAGAATHVVHPVGAQDGAGLREGGERLDPADSTVVGAEASERGQSRRRSY
jgi:hypothetical protein